MLYRIAPRLMQVDNKEYSNPKAFNDEYGVTERTYQVADAVSESGYNANSRSKKRMVAERQKPAFRRWCIRGF